MTTETTTQQRPSPSLLPMREDCWTEEATSTLVEAWGERHLELNRGNLRQKHWQEVADVVNDLHHSTVNNKKHRRTDVQCKNRIDTLKKKYKVEKSRVSNSTGTGGNVTWAFFDRLDSLIGSPSAPVVKKSIGYTLALPYRKVTPSLPLLPHGSAIPVAPRSVREKRPSRLVEDSVFKRSYSAFAAAAAAADLGSSRSSSDGDSKGKDGGGVGEEDGVRDLAAAIGKFGEVYERVEEVRQRQVIELERQRMEHLKSVEFQRMQMFMDWQVQLEKIKRSKRAVSAEAGEIF
ncbi:hypothetical protein GIB67_032098 [Kingdonia uniflora]|uniref:Myb/SANT-like DNA-binding domain-containing protein n=1 Tax=Kingdonia uniflora TaxID=39325 RepID=A0A7J7MWY0_9MAGN|nr:hypothetical protein GIB67_032098 [Kingdonia uniflora]